MDERELAERQHRTHHELRLMLSCALDLEQLDITEHLIAKAKREGLLIQKDIEDLAAYGYARRAGMTGRRHK